MTACRKLNDKLKLSHKARVRITIQFQTLCYDLVLRFLQEEPEIPSKFVNEVSFFTACKELL